VSNFDEVPETVRDRDIPATVPGCVHTDLLAAGLIEDPYLDRNEEKVQWIGRTDWRYQCTFDAPANWQEQERVDLVCEGLDTIATVELNGQRVGETANMHHPHRFNIKALLRPQGNTLSITFASAWHYAQAMQEKLGNRPCAYPQPFNFIRKMACNFGWDWGPILITAGIWQPIYLQAWNRARIAAVRPLVQSADANSAKVEVLVDLELAQPGSAQDALNLQVMLTAPNGEKVQQNLAVSGKATTVPLEVDKPQLWWPRGYGEQPLYDIAVSLQAAPDAGETLDEWSARIGLRTVRLNTDADEIGSQFIIEVNGKPIFCKGANWIPDDCFPHRIDEARYRQRIEQSIAANMNMLRVWGGGLYESETFYRLCDELGVLVWQDFLFACAAYPEESPFDKLVEAEARHNITRLSKHPSLVLWNGNNENIWGYFDWGWQEKLENRSWGLGFYLELFPKLVAELDPSRPYWPGSPYSGSMEIPPLDDGHGNKHVWDAWNTDDYTIYRDYTPRFVSEFGHQAPPTWPTLQRAIPADQLTPDSPAMLHHQKAIGGNDKLNNRLAEHFEIPADFDDWLYLTQLNQARAMITGVEWFRSRQPVCWGTLYWQINDCWPVTSWAAIDGDARLKPLWYATRQFYADRLLTFQPDKGNAENSHLTLYAINDTDEAWRENLKVERVTFEGQVLGSHAVSIEIAPRSCQAVLTLPQELAEASDRTREYLRAVEGNQQPATALWFFARDKDLNYPAPSFDAALKSEGATHYLTITAHSLLRDVAVFVDRLDVAATIDDQLVTIQPGDIYTFEIQSEQPLTQEQLISPPIFQCANRFGRVR